MGANKVRHNSIYQSNIFHICVMRIAINARLLLKNKLEGIGWHAYELISRMIKLLPEHQFILFYDRSDGIIVPEGKNVAVKTVRPVTRHPLLLWFWVDFSLKKAVIESGAEVFYSPEPIMPKELNIKKIITVHDISPKIMPYALPFSHRIYYHYILQRNIPTADHLITVSDFSKQEIVSHYGVNPNTISVIYNAARESFRPLTEMEKADIRNTYTGGERYFIYLGSINERKNTDTIIHAFDIYKSTNKSGQKLILAGKRMGKFDKVIHALADSDFKNDIIELGYVEDSLVVKLVASAEVLINLSEYEGFGMPLVEAMRSGVPVVASNKSCFPEIIKDAGILTDPQDKAQIAKDIFTAVLHSSDLIEKGIKRSTQFNWDSSAKLLSNLVAGSDSGL